MAARAVTRTYSAQRAERELEDLQLVLRARNGDTKAMDTLIRRYTGFVRLKSSSYFLAGGDSEDLIQEGLIGLYKAVRDFRSDKETSFRSFAELCITRQIITAIKTATRFKHSPLNTYVSFSQTPAGQESEGDCTLGDALPGPSVDEPSIMVISTEELQSLVFCLGTGLSQLESDALRLYLEGSSYEEMAERLEVDTKTIDNALQRVKRKILQHQESRQVLQQSDAQRGRDGVFAERLKSVQPGRCSRTGNSNARLAAQGREGLDERCQAPLGGGDDDDKIRLEAAGSVHEALDRRVRAEVGDAPASPVQREAECDQPEVVQLARRASEDRARSLARVPATADPQQPAPDQVAGEVLLCDCRLARRPPLAELDEVGEDHGAEDSLDRERGEQGVERRLGAGLVEAVERSP